MLSSNFPLFSIITVTYNAGKVLPITLQSIHNQGFTDYEWICIDGGSKDDTLVVIKNSPIKKNALVSEKDQGLYDAMNKGIALAKGKYLWFMNAGDAFFDTTTLEKVALIIQSTNADAVFGEVERVNLQGQRLGSRHHATPKALTWKSFKYGMNVSHQSFAIKKSLAPMYNLNYRICADIDWMIAGLKNCHNVVNVGFTTSLFLVDGLSSKKYKQSWKERFAIFNKYYGVLGNCLNHVVIVLNYIKRKIFKNL